MVVRRKAPKAYYALEKFDLSFQPREVRRFKKRWKEGLNVIQIHEELLEWDSERTIDEVIILCFDLSYNGLIEPRVGGVLGNG